MPAALGKQEMLEWLGSHYAETVGTLALIVTTTNLTISIHRLRREARAAVSPTSSSTRQGDRPDPDAASAPPAAPVEASEQQPFAGAHGA